MTLDLDLGFNDPSEPAKIAISELQSLNANHESTKHDQVPDEPAMIPVRLETLLGQTSQAWGLEALLPPLQAFEEPAAQFPGVFPGSFPLGALPAEMWPAHCDWWPAPEAVLEQPWLPPCMEYLPDLNYWPCPPNDTGFPDVSALQAWPQEPAQAAMPDHVEPLMLQHEARSGSCCDDVAPESEDGSAKGCAPLAAEDMSTAEDEVATRTGDKVEELFATEDVSTTEDESPAPTCDKVEELSTSEDEISSRICSASVPDDSAELAAASHHLLHLLKQDAAVSMPELPSMPPPGLEPEGFSSDDLVLIRIEERESRESGADEWNNETFGSQACSTDWDFEVLTAARAPPKTLEEESTSGDAADVAPSIMVDHPAGEEQHGSHHLAAKPPVPSSPVRSKPSRSDKRRRTRTTSNKHSPPTSPKNSPDDLHATDMGFDDLAFCDPAKHHVPGVHNLFRLFLFSFLTVLFAASCGALLSPRAQAAAAPPRSVARGMSHAWTAIAPRDASSHLRDQRIAVAVQHVNVETARGHAIAASIKDRLAKLKQGARKPRKSKKAPPQQPTSHVAAHLIGGQALQFVVPF